MKKSALLFLLIASLSALLCASCKDFWHPEGPPKPFAEINVRQETVAINNAGVHNIGSVFMGSTRDITFTIQNTGTANLVLTQPSGGAVISLTGNAEGFFSITQQPPSMTVPPKGNTTFTVRFNPSTTGNSFNAVVHFSSNSRNNAEFSFGINGNGI